MSECHATGILQQVWAPQHVRSGPLETPARAADPEAVAGAVHAKPKNFTEAAGIFQADDGSAMPSSAQASGVDDQVVEARPEAQASKELVMDTDTYCCCDLQVQVRSTGEETYMLVERRRSSVGCP